MTISVDWDKYLDQSVNLVNMARKVTFLEADKRVLAEENNELKRELNDKRNSYKQFVEGHKKLISDFNAVRRLLEKAIEENALLRRKLSIADKWNEAKKKQIQGLRKSKIYTEAVEVCSHCMSENVYPKYDVVGNNYTAICKNCGEEIMLCDECLHADDNKERKCDWSEENGCFRKKGR